MRLVGDDYHVVTVGDDWMGLASLRAELVDEGEHIAVIFSKKLAKIRGSGGTHVFLGDHARIEKFLVGLLIEVVTIGDDDKRPVTGPLAKDLLGEEEHRDGLSRPLRVPEHAKSAPIVWRCLL